MMKNNLIILKQLETTFLLGNNLVDRKKQKDVEEKILTKRCVLLLVSF